MLLPLCELKKGGYRGCPCRNTPFANRERSGRFAKGCIALSYAEGLTVAPLLCYNRFITSANKKKGANNYAVFCENV